MNESQSSRWLAWTGPLFFIVFFVAVFVLSGETPGDDATAAEVVEYYDGRQGRTLATVFMTPAMCALLVVFASHLRTLARNTGNRIGAGPTVLVSGAVLWAAGMLLGSTLELTLIGAADDNQNQVAEAVNEISAAAWLPFIGGIAITLIGAGMTVLGTGLLPKWLGWVALVIGIVALVGPGGFAGFFVGPLFLLVAGVLLATRSRNETPPATTG